MAEATDERQDLGTQTNKHTCMSTHVHTHKHTCTYIHVRTRAGLNVPSPNKNTQGNKNILFPWVGGHDVCTSCPPPTKCRKWEWYRLNRLSDTTL